MPGGGADLLRLAQFVALIGSSLGTDCGEQDIKSLRQLGCDAAIRTKGGGVVTVHVGTDSVNCNCGWADGTGGICH